ncbi:MAG: lipid-A-disaccharide synthase [Desulfarculus sp.]|nr:MAG: lipid-A-disaccharide synthase [Desulfarculus sp.]
MGQEPLRVVLVAGEASGDQHGAKLVRQLRELCPEAAISGVGGPALEASGVRLLYRAEDLTLVGFSEVLPKLKVILGALKGMKRHLKEQRPDLLILIDFPDFNFRLGKAARRLGVPVLYYISPQVWAWRAKRAQQMAGFVDHLACVFPFEQRFFQLNAPMLPLSFVGHPLLDEPEEFDPRSLPVPQDAEVMGLLPGSRMSEVRMLLPMMLQAARIMREQRPGLHFVLPLAPGLPLAKVQPLLKRLPSGTTVLTGLAPQAMARARALLVCSGTATLQAALAGTPMVVVYKTGGFNYRVARSLIRVEHIAMPNLIIQRRLVPELIQETATPEKLAAEGLRLLTDEERRQRMIQGLRDVRLRLGGPGASRRVAELALSMMEKKPR